MGYLLIDNGPPSAVTNVPTGKHEFDTVACRHCGAVIKIVLKGVTRAYETQYRCQRCDGPICRYCGEQLGAKCSPVKAKIENALKGRRWNEIVEYNYRSVSNR